MNNLKSKSNDIWVFIETKEDGTPQNVGLELLNPGRMLADKTGGKLVAVVIGNSVDASIEEAGRYGADQVIVVEGPEYKIFSTEAYRDALYHVISKYMPSAVMVGATQEGRDFAPRVASKLDTGLTADCTSVDIDEATGCVAWTRPTFGGNLMATIMCTTSRPQMGTIRPGVYKKTEVSGKNPEVIREEYHVAPENIHTEFVEFIKETVTDFVDLEGADIIVSGGRGVGGPEGFKPVQELADALGGVVGSSRAAVDAGWISHAHQVGQTGKTVAPKLYIACGISGAIQHLAGMSGSDCIVAINKDPDAPIFEVANYGIVGDLFQVLPAMTEEVKKLKG